MKNALVTGASRGIGLAITNALIKNGYFVYACCVQRESTLLATIDPAACKIIRADLSNPAGVDQLTDEMLAIDGLTLDCIALNAGGTCKKSFQDIGYEDWDRVMNLNVSMPFFIVQKLYNMIGRDASVIFIGSDMGIYPHAISIPYSVSKAAVHMLAKSLVKTLVQKNIRVNAIAPGFIDTSWQKEKPTWLREKIEEKISLRRFGIPEEIAEACLALINNAYINGVVLQVDGGYDME